MRYFPPSPSTSKEIKINVSVKKFMLRMKKKKGNFLFK